MNPKISVIMPTHNRSRHLRNTLMALMEQDLPSAQWEVVVVDNACSDDTSAVLDRFLPSMPLVRTSFATPNRARARNVAVEAARGDVLLFLDDDCLAPPSLLRQHLAAHVGRDRHVVVGARAEALTIEPAKDADLKVFARVAENMGFDGLDYFPIAHPINWEEVKVHSVLPRWVSDRPYLELVERIQRGDSPSPWQIMLTSHCSATRRLVEDIGGFDDAFVNWGEEDAELGFRMWKANASFSVLEDHPVYHQVHPIRLERWNEWLVNYLHFVETSPYYEVLLRWRPIMSVLSFGEYDSLVTNFYAASNVEQDRLMQEARRGLDNFLEMCAACHGLMNLLIAVNEEEVA